ncbi:MAG: hypothetical protein QOF53_2989 [Nocardioidaceae bacterium]|nr:hypothetical protein [Nocardioidaceae bacterium]
MRHRTTRRLLVAAFAVALGALSACSGSREVASGSSAGSAARAVAPGLARAGADSLPQRVRATVRTQWVLRIPVAKFHTAKQSLEKLGKLTYSHESARDVTTQVIDVNERVQTLQNSLDRLQHFQRSATDVADLLRFENQITRRQSELRSTRAQQSYLQSQTSLSTITAHLSTPDNPVSEPGALDDAGFLSGLRGGWTALQDMIVVAVTVAGALMPFLATLAVLGWPTWLLLRALHRRRHASSPAGPAAPAES